MINREYTTLNYILIFILSLSLNNFFITLSKPQEVKSIANNTIIIETKCVYTETPPQVNPKVLPKPRPTIDANTYLLAQIIYAEARNQPYNGMLAVGNVILNRVESPGFPKTIRAVIYQRGQFSPVSNGAINNKPNNQSIQAAKDVINGVRVVGKNVLFFYEPNIAEDEWIRTRKVVTKIGDHVFAL